MTIFSKKTVLVLLIAFNFSPASAKNAPFGYHTRMDAHTTVLPAGLPLAQNVQPPQNLFRQLSWNIFAYSFIEVLCQQSLCSKSSGKKKNIHAILKAVFWGGFKEVLIRILWNNAHKGKAVLAHLILQNLCVLKQTSSAESFKNMLAESACKTFMPPLLLYAQHKRQQLLRD